MIVIRLPPNTDMYQRSFLLNLIERDMPALHGQDKEIGASFASRTASTPAEPEILRKKCGSAQSYRND